MADVDRSYLFISFSKDIISIKTMNANLGGLLFCLVFFFSYQDDNESRVAKIERERERDTLSNEFVGVYYWSKWVERVFYCESTHLMLRARIWVFFSFFLPKAFGGFLLLFSSLVCPQHSVCYFNASNKSNLIKLILQMWG